MRIVKDTSPYIHKKQDLKRMMLDVIIALTPIVLFGIIQFGLNAVKVLLTSIITMLICEFLFIYLTNEESGFKNKIKNIKYNLFIRHIYTSNILTCLISATIYALIMPSSASVYIVMVGAIGGYVLGKSLYGGTGCNIFNPAALGRVIVLLCFDEKLSYQTPLISGVDVLVGATPLQDFSLYTLSDLFFGKTLGSIGEINKLLIILGGIYLFIRSSADYRVTVSFILTFVFLIFIYHIINYSFTDSINKTLYHLLSGGVLFGAVFMITDPVTSPVTKVNRITFGIIIAILVVLIRIFGIYPEGVCFAILISNMLVSVIDYPKWSKTKLHYSHLIIWGSLIIMMVVIIVLGAKL